MKDWLIATIAIAALGWFFGMLQPTFFTSAEPNAKTMADPHPLLVAIYAASFGAIAGAVFGAVQWCVLKRSLTKTWVWIPANAIGWAAALVIIYLGATMPDPTWTFPAVVACGIATGAAAGLAIGAVTSFGLRWICVKNKLAG